LKKQQKMFWGLLGSFACGSDCNFLSLLLEVRADGLTPLQWEALIGCKEKVKQLIEAKADVNLPVGDTPHRELKDKTPLTLAFATGSLGVAAMLLEARGLDLAAEDISFLVQAEGPTAVECLEKIPKEAHLGSLGFPMERANIREQLGVILEHREMIDFESSQKFCFIITDEPLESQNLFTRPKVQASLKYIPCLSASDACNPELLKSLAYTTNDEIFHTHTVAALVQAAWMQKRLATAGEVFVSLLMVPFLCHASFTLRHEQPHSAEPGH